MQKTSIPWQQWQIVAASVAGTSHRKIGRGCDDAHAYLQLDNGTLLLAVTDGAGSAKRSAEGARCLVRPLGGRSQAAPNPGHEAAQSVHGLLLG